MTLTEVSKREVFLILVSEMSQWSVPKKLKVGNRGAVRTGQWVQLHPSILDKIYDLTGKLEKSQDFAEFEAKHIRFATVI